MSLPGLPWGDTSSSYRKTRGSGAFGKRTHSEMFGSSDESDDSVEDRKDDVSASTDINVRGVDTSIDTNARGVGTSIDTTQEPSDRRCLASCS